MQSVYTALCAKGNYVLDSRQHFYQIELRTGVFSTRVRSIINWIIVKHCLTRNLEEHDLSASSWLRPIHYEGVSVCCVIPDQQNVYGKVRKPQSF